MDTKNKILSFGAVVWDIIEGVPYIGGAPFNLAAHLAKCGVSSYMLTRVGQDEFGERSLAEIDRLGVHRRYVQIDPEHATPTVLVTLSETGQPSYEIKDNVSYDHIRADDRLADEIVREEFTAFCFGTIEQRSPTTRESLRTILQRLKDTRIFFDVNLRLDHYNREILSESLKYATMLKLNDEEAHVLGDMLLGKSLSQREFADRVRVEYDIATVLVTRGERGCLVVDDGVSVEIPGLSVDVADTVGPGDAFSAGFLARLCCGESAVEAAEFANRLGAFVASRRGAIPAYSADLEQMIKQDEGH